MSLILKKSKINKLGVKTKKLEKDKIFTSNMIR